MPSLTRRERRIVVPNERRYSQWAVNSYKRSNLTHYLTFEQYLSNVLLPRTSPQTMQPLFREFRVDMHLRPEQRRDPCRFTIDPNDSQWLKVLRHQVIARAKVDRSRHGLLLSLNGQPLQESSLRALLEAPRHAVIPSFAPHHPRVEDMEELVCERRRRAAAERERRSLVGTAACAVNKFADGVNSALQDAAATVLYDNPLVAVTRVIAHCVASSLTRLTHRENRVCNSYPQAYAATYQAFNAPSTYIQAGIADAPRNSADIREFWARHGQYDSAECASAMAHDVARAITKIPAEIIRVNGDTAGSDEQQQPSLVGAEMDTTTDMYSQHLINESVLGRLGRSLDTLFAGQGSTVNVHLSQDFTPVPEDPHVYERIAGDRHALRDGYSRIIGWLDNDHISGVSDERDADRETAMRSERYNDWATVSPATRESVRAPKRVPLLTSFLAKAKRPHRARKYAEDKFVACAAEDAAAYTPTAVRLQQSINASSSSSVSTTLRVCAALEDTKAASNVAAKSTGLRAVTPMIDSAAQVASNLTDSMPALREINGAIVDSMPPLREISGAIVDSMPKLRAVQNTLTDSMPALVARVSKPVDSVPELRAITSNASASRGLTVPVSNGDETANDEESEVHIDGDEDDADASYYNDAASSVSTSVTDTEEERDSEDDVLPTTIAAVLGDTASAPAKQQPAAVQQFLRDLVEHANANIASDASAVVLVVPTSERATRALSLIRGMPAEARASILNHYVCANSITHVVTGGLDNGAGGLLTARSGTQWDVKANNAGLVVNEKSRATGTLDYTTLASAGIGASVEKCANVRVLYTDATHRDV